MTKSGYESSLQGGQNGGSENSTVRVQAGSYKLTDDDRKRLAELAARPDEEIDFSDIPRLTKEEREEATRMIAERKAKLRKAS